MNNDNFTTNNVIIALYVNFFEKCFRDLRYLVCELNIFGDIWAYRLPEFS